MLRIGSISDDKGSASPNNESLTVMHMRTTGWKPFMDFFSGAMVSVMKWVGSTVLARDKLKMSVKTSARCSTQALSTLPRMPSGSATLCVFTLLRVTQTSLVKSGRGRSMEGIAGLMVL